MKQNLKNIEGKTKNLKTNRGVNEAAVLGLHKYQDQAP